VGLLGEVVPESHGLYQTDWDGGDAESRLNFSKFAFVRGAATYFDDVPVCLLSNHSYPLLPLRIQALTLMAAGRSSIEWKCRRGWNQAFLTEL